MTVHEAIAEADLLKPNMFGEAEKIKWLSRLETRIYEEVICTHKYNEGEEPITFNGLKEGDGEKELLVGQPYDEMYIHWLEAMIDYHNMETEGFNNANAVFESVYGSFRNAYNQSHRPKSARKRFF